jgi:hypothetical protein
VRNPTCTVKLDRGAWVGCLKATRGTHTGVGWTTKKDTGVVLRDWGQRRPGVAPCTTCNTRNASGHRTTSSGTPPRSCSTLPPHTPPTRRWPGLSLSQAARKQSSAIAKWRHPASPSKAPRRTPRSGKKRRKWGPQWVAVVAGYDDDNDKIADDSDKEYVMAAGHRVKRQARPLTYHFERHHVEAYPNHAYPIKHKLRDCHFHIWLKCFFAPVCIIWLEKC